MDDIDCVNRAKSSLLQLSNEKMNGDYTYILEILDKYLVDHCNHNIVTDLIDIDPDRSITIKYCTRCMTTFK